MREDTASPTRSVRPGPPTPDEARQIAAGRRVGAAVDIGATSVHLLVAAVGDHELTPIHDTSAFLGLGDRVTRHGFFGASLRAELATVLAEMASTARDLSADERITFVGTDPVRRAADGAVACRAVQEASGIPLHVLEHREEGLLTVLGVTLGRRPAHGLVVVDVGGGSSELVVAQLGAVPVTHGLPIGAARLTQAHDAQDPPTLAELEAMRADAAAIVGRQPSLEAGELVAVGGTASNLRKVLRARVGEGPIDRAALEAALAIMIAEPSASVAETYALRPERARLLPAGALILDAVMARHGTDRLRISEAGIREGAVLGLARAGPAAWRDHLAELVLGW